MAPELLEVLKVLETDWRQDLQKAAVKYAMEFPDRVIFIELRDENTKQAQYSILLAGDEYSGKPAEAK